MTPEDLDKLISDPKTWVVKDFNNINNIYFNLEQIEILIESTTALLKQKHNDSLHFKDFENTKKSIEAIDTVRDILFAAEEKERSRN
jgi:hypothetical protein